MDRETIKVKTKSGHDLELKTYLTERENREMLKGVLIDEIEIGDNQGKVKKVSSEMLTNWKDARVKAFVVSLDGNVENILERCLDMKREEFAEIIAEIGKVAGDEEDADEKEKKTK